jgi:lathosterol oxidase
MDAAWMDLGGMKLVLVPLGISLLFKAMILGVGEGTRRTRWGERWRVFRRALAPGQVRSEAVAALTLVPCDLLIAAAFHHFVRPRMGPPSGSAALLTYAWMFVGFEVWFYVSHRLLHTRALYRLHAQHHVAQVTDVLTSLSFSLAERLVLMGGGFGLVLLAQGLIPVSRAGVMAYMLTNYTLNVLGHSNTEWLPERFVSSWAGRVFFTPTFHALHHARYQGHYGLFTVLMDRWGGTAFEDYSRVHARARAGEGLTRIGERLPPVVTTPQPEAIPTPRVSLPG